MSPAEVAETEGIAEVQAEEKTSSEVPQLEEKTSAPIAEIERKPEEKTSAKGKRNKRYDGSGRRNNDEEVDEILDAYLQYGILPQDVSERMRREYKKHPRLELRRMYLERAGLIKKGKAGKTGKHSTGSNVLPYRRKGA